MRRELNVGDIVKLKVDMLGNPEGTQGVVYEVYHLGEDRGVSVIFENGEYDGFSPTEQNEYLERIGHAKTIADYKFVNVIKVSQDFEVGVFDEAFE